jgi:hypothetical protein
MPTGRDDRAHHELETQRTDEVIFLMFDRCDPLQIFGDFLVKGVAFAGRVWLSLGRFLELVDFLGAFGRLFFGGDFVAEVLDDVD